MALSEQCINDLNQVMNHLRMVGVNMMSARRAFENSGDYGVAAMLRGEGMERYHIGGKIADFLTKHKAVVRYDATPASTMQTGNVQTLQALMPIDSQTVEVLDAMIAAANGRKSYPTAYFMFEIKSHCQKEYGEIRDITGEISRISSDAGAMVQYDAFLLAEYCDKYHGYDMC